MDKSETHATLVIHDTGQISVRENRRENIKNGQSGNTGHMGHTHMTNTNKTKKNEWMNFGV